MATVLDSSFNLIDSAVGPLGVQKFVYQDFDIDDFTHNQVLGLAQEPLLQLLEPSLRVMIDKVPQARARIAVAQRRICEALQTRDAETARSWMAKHIRDFRKGYEIAKIDLTLHVAHG